MRESLERERGGEKNRKGYIHNVDQSSISFFVTNFPEDCTTEDLWKVFGRFGRLGDVYIPNKVDKWGKRFAFVKFREDRHAMELCNEMDDVWIGTYKLRVNKSRFGRREEERKKEEPVTQKKLLLGDGSNNLNRSFKEALENAHEGRKVGSDMVVTEDVLDVKVEGNVLKELQESYVGKLAVNIEVYRIRTILFMEGLAHISVTDMGRKMVLIHSPKKGEIAKMWKDRIEWISYYFREVQPWSPNCFADRRDTWVKVYGIPLHIWGENLFKAIGGKYGEFLDFDNNTAAKTCIKISTDFRSAIDDPVIARALGVNYTLRVVEEKVIEQGFYQGELMEDEECSWVASVNNPGEGRVFGDEDGGPLEVEVEVNGKDDGGHGGSDDGEVHVEYEETQSASQQVHGDGALHDGDGSEIREDMRQDQIPLSGGILVTDLGNFGQKGSLAEVLVAKVVENHGAQGEKQLLSETVEGIEDDGIGAIATCQMEIGADLIGESKERGDALNGKQIRFIELEPTPSISKTRFSSLPPNRTNGPHVLLGRNLQKVVDLNDSISLIEERGGGADNKNVCPSNSNTVSQFEKRRGRSRKPRDKSKNSKNLFLAKPKFVQLGEALKDGGDRRKKRYDDEARGRVSDLGEATVEGSDIQPSDNSGSCSYVPESDQGLRLEVVLPICQSTPASGFAILQQGDADSVPQQRCVIFPESSKLLKLQQQVGFKYSEPDEDVVEILAKDEQSDRLKKQEWEQKNGLQ
jgi:hypothetical protein